MAEKLTIEQTMDKMNRITEMACLVIAGNAIGSACMDHSCKECCVIDYYKETLTQLRTRCKIACEDYGRRFDVTPDEFEADLLEKIWYILDNPGEFLIRLGGEQIQL